MEKHIFRSKSKSNLSHYKLDLCSTMSSPIGLVLGSIQNRIKMCKIRKLELNVSCSHMGSRTKLPKLDRDFS